MFGRHGMPPPASNPDLWPFDLETGVRVASKVGNLPSKFGHAMPLGSRIIRYVRDRQTDRRTDRQKQPLLPLPYGWGHWIKEEKCWRRNFLRDTLSPAAPYCTAYSIPDRRDNDTVSSLRNPNPFHTNQARTNKFRKLFIPYCLDKYT